MQKIVKKRRGFTWGLEGTARLIYVALGLIFLLALLKGAFKYTGDAEKSFDDLASLLNSLEDKDTKPLQLTIDKSSYFLFFNKGFDLRYALTGYGGMGVTLKDSITIKRPQQCPAGTACLVWCGKLTDEAGDIKTCSKVKKQVPINKDKSKAIKFEGRKTYNFLQGFFINYEYLSEQHPNEGDTSKGYTLYFQDHKGTIGMCDKKPCFSDEEINKRISLAQEEIVKKNFEFAIKSLIGVDANSDGNIETFFYINDLVKDDFGSNYYKYKFGYKTEDPSQAAFLETVQEKEKKEFELKIRSYAAAGKIVNIDEGNSGSIAKFSSDRELKV